MTIYNPADKVRQIRFLNDCDTLLRTVEESFDLNDRKLLVDAVDVLAISAENYRRELEAIEEAHDEKEKETSPQNTIAP